MEISQQAPAAKAGNSLEDLLAALGEAISVFVARLREPGLRDEAAPAAPHEASPPNCDYF